jgi:hypothetical protein
MVFNGNSKITFSYNKSLSKAVAKIFLSTEFLQERIIIKKTNIKYLTIVI